MGVYRPPSFLHIVRDVPGTVASNTLLSVFNPPGSGRLVSFFGAEVASYAVGGAGGSVSIDLYRITAASGGTLVPASQVSRPYTDDIDPVTEVRQGNPATTVDASWPLPMNAWPPPQSTGAGANPAVQIPTPFSGPGFVCLPGQGLAYTVPAGDTDQRWKVFTIWMEREL